MHATEPRYPRPTGATDLARRATLGIGVAVVAVLAAQVLVDALGVDVGASGPTSPFAATPLVSSTIVSGAGATVVYAGLVRYTGRPVRNFVALSVVVFALLLLPAVLVAPSLGISPAGQAVLVGYHVLVAVPITAFLVGAVPR